MQRAARRITNRVGASPPQYADMDGSPYDDEYGNDGSEGEPETHPFVRETKKVGRNDPCPCGSGKKNKKC